MKKNILRIILIILILIWMYIVFILSNAGGEESTGISMKIAKFFIKDVNHVRIADQIIRKIAHLSEYALGGFLVYALMLTFKFNCKLQLILAWIFTTVYAISDEIHQLFIPGRTGKVVDVFIDSLGALIGICVLLFFAKVFKNINQLKFKRENQNI